MIGRLLGPYEVVAKLGEGGMGEVYRARDTRLDRVVAIKLLPAALTLAPDRIRRFIQEAKAVSALNHPNIVTIHEFGHCDAGRFIVMELVQGRTLRQLDQPCALELLVDLGSQTARALSVTHAAGITHRDIKPDNIMLRDDGYVKVLDFGVAQLAPHGLDTDAETLQGTLPGTLLGTIKYMSPEQARGSAVSHASDIFALGIVLYELATGRHPFTAKTQIGYLHAISGQVPLPPTSARPDIPAGLEVLILGMLEKEARQRPTANEVADALQALEQHVTAHTPRSSIRPATPAPRRHIVGRERERAELRAAFNQAQAGRGSLLCVGGEPGIGKTTLVEDFLAELATGHHCTIARGRCSERLAGTEAYLPLLEALDSVLRSGSYPTLAGAMKQLAPTWYAQVVPLSGDSEQSARLLADVKAASQERMKRELAAFLRTVAHVQPLVIFFDDLHWADVSTIDLLSFLAGKFDELKVLIVATYRPSDLLLAKHPFLQIKPDLQARGLCRELLPEFLTEMEIADYLALEFPGHEFPAEFPQLIHAKTEGSPLFMADLVRYLRDRRVIASTSGSRSGAWTLAQALPDINRELPESVRGMIERKISQLSEEDRKLLTVASVQGYQFDSAVVAQALDLDAAAVEERLEKLDRMFAFVKLTSEAEFPNRTPTLKYRFVHVLYQNALYAGVRATRKATLSRSVAQALEACYSDRRDSVANELALLWEAARDDARAAEYFLQAARTAAQINGQREAVQLAEHGLDAVRRLPESPERDARELGLQLTLGFSLQSARSWVAPETGAAFNRARTLCERMGDDPRFFAALVGVWAYHIAQAEYATAHGLCERMLQLAEQSRDSVLLVVACMCLAKFHYYQGDFVTARQVAERAIALDRREYHEAYLSLYNEDSGLSVRREHSYCLWALGYPDRALALAYETVSLAEQVSHPFSLGAAHLMTAANLARCGEWQASESESRKVLTIAEEYALGDMVRHSTVMHTLMLAFQEPTDEGVVRAKQAIDSMTARGLRALKTGSLASMGRLLGRAGRCAEGLAVIAEALALVEDTGERYSEAELWRVRGELLLKASGDAHAEAEGCYHKALEIARRQRAKGWELRAATSLARLWHRQGNHQEARELLAEIYGWFSEGFDTSDLKHARGLLDELSSEASA